MLVTGGAGTGKSYLLKLVVNELSAIGKVVFVTATTGMAAFEIGGTTIHSFAGFRNGNRFYEFSLEKLSNNDRANWRRCETLIMDEISLMSADMLDCIEELARRVRGNRQVFGGVQVIFFGDFAQLPPVEERAHVSARYAFEAKCWDALISINVRYYY